MMDSFQVFIALMCAATILVGISQKIRIPYPIALVLGGLALGFTPIQHSLHFDPQLILVIVLPPILYYGAFGIRFREFKENWKPILSLSLGLVAFTTLVCAVIFKWIFPEYSWALAFTFGAIVSPPDAIAATSILKRFDIRSGLLTILEGESLVNDASALVLYKISLAALLSGTFSFLDASVDFVKVVIGGIIIGLVSGFLLQNFSRKYLAPVVGVVFSFTIPYITYIFADKMGASGVLAVVFNGLVGSRVLLRHHSSLRRILGFAVWDIFIILMNCFVFILIGMHLQVLAQSMTAKQMVLYSLYALGFTLAMIVIRMCWVYARSSLSYLKALQKPNANEICPHIVKESALIGWSGMRGIVSLTAALALPYTLENGMPLEGREGVIFMVFVVILLTLLIPGLTLPTLIRWLKIHYHRTGDVLGIRKRLTKTAINTISKLKEAGKINQSESHFLTSHFQVKLGTFDIESAEPISHENLELAKNSVVQEQRKELFNWWKNMEIDDKLFLQLEQELDLEEIHLARAELN